jgi:hypothetical protein
MGFHEVRFPANLSFGSVGGPERRTEIVTLVNGFEERNSPWADSRRRYDAGVGLRSLDDLQALIAFFEARRGQLHGFRWKDWADFKSSPASRPVVKPVAGSVLVGIEGVPKVLGADFGVDATTGTVTFADPPPRGAQVTAGFEFDVPVRFDTDRIQVSVASFQAGDVPVVPVIEVRQ